MESESKWPAGLRRKLLLGLGASFVLLGLVVLVMGLVETYSYIDSALAQSLKYDLDDACAKNMTFRPISFAVVGQSERKITCGWEKGPTALRAIACLVALVTGVGALLVVLKFKVPSLQYVLSGVAAFAGLLFFVSVIVDGNHVNQVSTTAICYIGQIGGSTDTFECYAGRFIAVVVFDMLVAVLLVAYAVIAFFFVKSGRFAVEIAENASVDYFSEAERYFPSAGAEEGEK